LEDILSLDIGSVIELEDNSIDGKLFDILLDRHIIAQGRFVIIDEQLGIEVVKFKGIS
jgi:flagellar motor switch/type III secretory pathway protein FliN